MHKAMRDDQQQRHHGKCIQLYVALLQHCKNGHNLANQKSACLSTQTDIASVTTFHYLFTMLGFSRVKAQPKERKETLKPISCEVAVPLQLLFRPNLKMHTFVV